MLWVLDNTHTDLSIKPRDNTIPKTSDGTVDLTSYIYIYNGPRRNLVKEVAPMIGINPNKVYKIQVYRKKGDMPPVEIALGSKVEECISYWRAEHPDFRRIVVYDADTGDAVAIIKP